MDLATQTHLTSLRKALLYRRSVLRAEVAAVQRTRQQATDAAMSHDVSDFKDDAMHAQLDAVDDTQAARDLDELADVESALRRLDSGTYGNCRDCDDAIPLERLRAQPAALRCAGCQAAHETSLR